MSGSPSSRLATLAAAVVLGTSYLLGMGAMAPVRASDTNLSEMKGFDTCAGPSLSTM